MMKKILEVIGAVFLACVDGKKNTDFKSCTTRIKSPSLVFSNEGYLFYSVILSPTSNTFPVQFCSFSTN